MRTSVGRLLSYLLALGALLATPATASSEASPPRLVVGLASPIDTLDPHLNLDTRQADARLQLYDGLFRWQDGPVRITPWLAQSYTKSEDERSFRFALRKDAKFHDGRDVKASDVVYSVERILALKRGVAPLLAGLISPGSTKAVDAYTVEFSLTRASPLFLSLLPELSIVNAELLKANEVNNDWGRAWLQSNDAGSGVLALKSETPTGTLVLERFAGHWTGEAGSASNSAPSEIELRPSIDPELRVDGLVKGEIHIAQGTLLPHQLKRLRETKDVALLESDSPRAFMGLLHAGREPMKSLAFRRALAQAFDADRFTATTLVGATPLPVPLPPSLGTLPAGLAKPAYDLGAAAAAIAKIKPVPKELVIGAIAGEPHSERAALVMLDGLVKIGLSARIVTEPWPAVANRMRDEKQMYDILFLWRGTRYLDANNWLGELYDCDLFGQGNASWYCNRDIDRLVKEARFALDPKLRRQGYEKAAALLAEDQAGLFIASGRRPTAYAKRVKGLRASPVGEALELRGVTLD